MGIDNSVGADELIEAAISRLVDATRQPINEALAPILDDMRTTFVDRGANYADIADNSVIFTQVMQAMGVRLPEGMTAVEFHCLANISTKLCRIASAYAIGGKPHQDNWLDMAGYAMLSLADIRRKAQ